VSDASGALEAFVSAYWPYLAGALLLLLINRHNSERSVRAQTKDKKNP
jgi:hypothetical protein